MSSLTLLPEAPSMRRAEEEAGVRQQVFEFVRETLTKSQVVFDPAIEGA